MLTFAKNVLVLTILASSIYRVAVKIPTLSQGDKEDAGLALALAFCALILYVIDETRRYYGWRREKERDGA